MPDNTGEHQYQISRLRGMLASDDYGEIPWPVVAAELDCLTTQVLYDLVLRIKGALRDEYEQGSMNANQIVPASE